MNDYLNDIFKIINEESKIIVVLVIAEMCYERETTLEHVILQKYNTLTDKPRILRLCYDDRNMIFPRPQTEAVYYFMPKKLEPLFMRSGREAADRFVDDLQLVTKMMNGMSYVDAAFEKEEDRNLIEKTEKLLNSDDTKSKYPTTSKMLKGFAKDMWQSAKYVGKGLPVLVSSEVASERYSICEQCPHLTEEARCTECGCFMKKKVNLASASCPIGKWERVE